MEQKPSSIFPGGRVEKLKQDQLHLSSVVIEVAHVGVFLVLMWFILVAFTKKIKGKNDKE